MLVKWPRACGLVTLENLSGRLHAQYGVSIFERVSRVGCLKRQALELEVSMSAQFLRESDIVERIQIKSWSRKEGSSELGEVTFLGLPKVRAVTGLSKSSLYELIRENSFPPPVHLGARTVAWV